MPVGVGQESVLSLAATLLMRKFDRMLDKDSGPTPVAAINLPLARTTSGDLIEFSLIDAVLDRSVIAVGEAVRLDLAVPSADAVRRGYILPQVTTNPRVTDDDRSLEEVTADSDLDHRVLQFSVSIRPHEPGPYSLQIVGPGLGTYTRDMLVLSKRTDSLRSVA